MIASDQPLPCPFCGEYLLDNKTILGYEEYMHSNSECVLRKQFVTKNGLKKWNTRASNEKLEKCIIALKQIVAMAYCPSRRNEGFENTLGRIYLEVRYLLKEIGELK